MSLPTFVGRRRHRSAIPTSNMEAWWAAILGGLTQSRLVPRCDINHGRTLHYRSTMACFRFLRLRYASIAIYLHRKICKQKNGCLETQRSFGNGGCGKLATGPIRARWSRRSRTDTDITPDTLRSVRRINGICSRTLHLLATAGRAAWAYRFPRLATAPEVFRPFIFPHGAADRGWL